MKNIKQKVIEREKVTGRNYGKTFGGMYYKHLSLITKPVLRYIKQNYKKQDKIKIGDIAGGSGIVGNAVAAALRKAGYKNIELYVLDINSKQLRGVKYEQKHFGNEKIKVRTMITDIIYKFPKKFKNFFDVVTCRYLLHYFSKRINKRIISNLIKFAKQGGVIYLIFLTGKTKEQCKAITNWLNYLEKLNVKKPLKRYVIHKSEIMSYLKTHNCRIIFEKLIEDKIAITQLKEKFLLSENKKHKIFKYMKERSRTLNFNERNKSLKGPRYYLCFIKKH